MTPLEPTRKTPKYTHFKVPKTDEELNPYQLIQIKEVYYNYAFEFDYK